MNPTRPMLALLAALAAAAAAAQPATPATRGQMLYELHCIGCHSTQIHWRANRRATDWPTLRAQVRLWQGNAHLNWGERDIDDVARHLNDTIYRFERPATPIGAHGAPRSGT